MKGIIQSVSLNQHIGAPGDPGVSVITVNVMADPAAAGPTDKLNNLSYTLPDGVTPPTVGDTVEITTVITAAA
jgi:hypothetical protein